jgi:hypothetical protein
MDQGSRSVPRSRRRPAAVLAALAVVLALVFGAAMLSGLRAPWDIGEAGWPSHSASSATHATLEPMATETPAATATTGASATATASAGASPTVTPTVTPTVATTPGSAATPAPHVTPAPQLANLEIGGYSNPWLVCGIEFEMQIDVVNRGGTASRSTSARLVDRFGSTVAAQTVSAVPALAVDAHATIHLPFTVRTGCGVTHTMTITVDPENLVPETNEGNVLERTHTPLAKPNLTPAGLTVPASPTCATNFTVSVTVVNNGYGPALDGLVKFSDSYDSAILSSTMVSFPSLSAGSSRTVSATMKSSRYCNHLHQLIATVDFGDRVDEMYETDNVASRDFTPHLGG